MTTGKKNIISRDHRLTRKCLLNVVNENVPVIITTIEQFKTSYKYLITQISRVVKKSLISFSKEEFYLVRPILDFCYKYFTT